MRFSEFQELTVNLKAGEQTKRALVGSFFRILAADADFEIGVDGQSFISGFSGLGIAGDVDSATGERAEFSELYFRETLGAPNDIRIIVGKGQVFDDRVVFGGNSVPVDPITFAAPQEVVFPAPQSVAQSGGWAMDQASPNLWRNPGASSFFSGSDIYVNPTSNTEIVGARAGRKSVMLSNQGSETVWLRHDNIYNAMGPVLAPGEDKTIETSAAIYAVNISAISVRIGFAEEYWA